MDPESPRPAGAFLYGSPITVTPGPLCDHASDDDCRRRPVGYTGPLGSASLIVSP